MSATKYTIETLTPAVDNSTSIAGVLRYLGLKQAGGTQAHIAKRIKQLGLDTSHFSQRAHNKGKPALNRRTAESIFVVLAAGSFRTRRSQLLRAMLDAGFDYVCVICYNDGTWNGKSLTLEIDHIDGDWLNNLKDNLRFLCPNCHRQEVDTNKSWKNK